MKQIAGFGCLKNAFCLLPILFAALAGTARAAEPTVELLWPQGAPGATGNAPADKPTLTVFLPENVERPTAAVVICPGGGYANLAADHEGRQIAGWLNSFGVAGFVLEYRHAGRGYRHPAPMQDAQRAIRAVRAGAKRWNVDPTRIGVMGFSAGGHLASTAATHFDGGDPTADDPIERVGCRPDFLVLCYPVIIMGEAQTHRGSQKNLLGDKPDPALAWNLSNEKQVAPQTPPTFIFTTDEDKSVDPEHSLRFYLALHRAGVPAELHIYRSGRHGLGLAADVPGTSTWPERLKDWMRGLGLLKKK
ncbi:MAG: alpha/beta hydrolase [Pirellulales bacterium]|nr:alpha/beta hydrolase [Pirellulales bacterium]